MNQCALVNKRRHLDYHLPFVHVDTLKMTHPHPPPRSNNMYLVHQGWRNIWRYGEVSPPSFEDLPLKIGQNLAILNRVFIKFENVSSQSLNMFRHPCPVSRFLITKLVTSIKSKKLGSLPSQWCTEQMTKIAVFHTKYL